MYAKTVSFNGKDGWIRGTSGGPGTFDDPVEINEKPPEDAVGDPSKLEECARIQNDGSIKVESTGIWDAVREERDVELKKSDWAVLPDSPLSDSEVQAVEDYRQNLRDLPQDYSTPQEARDNWPKKPASLTK